MKTLNKRFQRPSALRIYRGPRLFWISASILAVSLGAAACSRHTPSGQVVVTVNGQEITTQDLAAEARASGSSQSNATGSLLNRVIAQTLLAQAAHSQGLDRDSGYPSDLARLKNDFLAQKELKATLKAPDKPTPADIAAFQAANPYVFRDRQNITFEEVRFETTDSMKSMEGIDSIGGVISRLKGLNVKYDQSDDVVDTSRLPKDYADKLVNEPLDKLFFVRARNSDVVAAVVVKGRAPVNVSATESDALASHLLMDAATQKQIAADIAKLTNAAKITYQPKYAPQKTPPANTPAQTPTAQ